MPFLNIKRLMPPRKFWKLFTKKLIKLHKPNKSKAIIKKPKFTSQKTTPKKIGWPSLSIQPKKFKPKPKPNRIIHLPKRPPPVYVDQLFIEPTVSVVKEQMKLPLTEQKERNKEEPCSSSEFKKNGEFASKNHEADEMWENLELGSSAHEMQEINERAEEFIARFRAQMHNQELLLARRRL